MAADFRSSRFLSQCVSRLDAQELRQLEQTVDFELSLQTETVEAAYPSEPLIVTPDTSVEDVLLLMQTQSTSCVLICEGDALEGIFTERDALKQMAAGPPWDLPIRDVMMRRVVTVPAETTVGQAIQSMAEGGYRRLTVVDQDDRPVCLTGARGIVHFLVEHFPESIYNLPPCPVPGQAEREGA